MLNEQGGINGRKIKLIQLDDAYTPPKTVEQTRKLVEQEKVAFIFAQLGTPTGMSTRKYLNDHKIPDVFVASGATPVLRPRAFPVGHRLAAELSDRGRIYAKYVLQTKPDAKIAVLAQNDDFGRDAIKGMRDGLGDKAEKMLVSTTSYETTDADDGLPGAQRPGLRRRRVLLLGHPEILRHDHPQGLRHGLEAAVHRRQSGLVGRHGADPGGRSTNPSA